MHARQPRSIAVHVEARNNRGVVEIVVRDHGPWHEGQLSTSADGSVYLLYALIDTVDIQTTREGTTVRLRRTLGQRPIGTGQAAITPARDRLDLLWRNPISAPLPGATRERFATPVSAASDETIIRKGDSADRFFLIAKGQLQVSAARHHIATLGPGDHVGEIALLRDVPRTATIIAKAPAELYALTPNAFLSAITSHHASARAAETTVTTRLAELQAVLGRTA